MAEIDRSSGRSPLINRIITSMLVVILVALVFTAGYAMGSGFGPQLSFASNGPAAALEPQPQTGTGKQTDEEFEVFWEVWDTVESRFYYDLPDEQTRVYGAINGLIESLGDEHSGFVDPESADFMRERLSGTFEGIGAVVETAPEGGVYILRVLDNSPADKAGLLAGDIIIEADGVDLTEKTLDEGVQLIRGPAGTPVNLTVLRQGESELLSITVLRGRIEFPTVEYEMLEGDIGYVALFDFYSLATDRTRDALRTLTRQGAKAIIFDLRGNGGGYLNQAIDVADLFLDRGIVLIQRDVDGNYIEYTSRSGDLAEDIPLVVLVDQNSASASEIVAGAIRDRERGTLIGVTTFGKGSVQTLYDLSDGSILRLTTANWYTPNDLSISEAGIEPDIVVEPQSPEEIEQGAPRVDTQLEAAIEYLRGELNPGNNGQQGKD
ncbi:MAG: S41 family peptidase [Anaerolineae bacterium]